MPSTTKTLTARDLIDTLSRVLPDTPVVVQAAICIGVNEADAAASYITYQGQLSIDRVYQSINCVELHACD